MLPIALFAVLPLGLLALVFELAIRQGAFAVDFHNSFWPAGRSVLEGNFAYDVDLRRDDPFVYPPLVAVLFAPIALLPVSVADGVYTAAGIACVVLALRTFGVRDWRCYGAAFLWPPFLAAVQAGNVSLLLLGGVALAWVVRTRPLALGLTIAVLVSMKLFLWPLGLWLLLTRRLPAAILAFSLFVVLNALAWVAIGAGSVTSYLGLLHRLTRTQGTDTYTLKVVATHAGLPAAVGMLLTGLAIATLLVVWWKRGRGDDRATLALAVLVALFASPIVWLHYLVLLLVPVALMRRSLSWPWLVPFVTLFCPGKGSGTLGQTALGVGVIAVVALAAFSRERRTNVEMSFAGG